MLWGEKPYYSLDYYLKQTFGSKTYKASLDAGFTCPNRDGTIGRGGCIFCSRGGSGEFAGSRALSIKEQIDSQIEKLGSFHAKQYIAYYQAFTNTYADLDYLRRVYEPSFLHEKVAVVDIATRPDCVGGDVVSLLCEYSKRKPVWVELGLQTSSETTAQFIRRGYPLSVYDEAVTKLKAIGIEVVTHVIAGLPGETKQDFYNTLSHVAACQSDGIKIQLLHILKGTDLASLYESGQCPVLTQEEYIDLVLQSIALLPPEMTIHRLTGDGPKELLLAPLWSSRKREVLNEIHKQLKQQNIWQGKEYKNHE